MSNTYPVVIEENWETYSYNVDQGPVFVTFFAGAQDIQQQDFPFCARVILPIKQPNENGGPEGEESERLWALEDQLIELLKEHNAPCLQVARLTHSGDRELVFQVADWDRFRPPVGLWMQQTPEYDSDVSEHDGWEFFEQHIWPRDEDWMVIMDRRVIDNLIRAGSDPEKEHALEFVFRGTSEQLENVRTQLQIEGDRPGKSESSEDLLVMVKQLPLQLGLVVSESLKNRQMCDEIGCEFDGWGAAVVN